MRLKFGWRGMAYSTYYMLGGYAAWAAGSYLIRWDVFGLLQATIFGLAGVIWYQHVVQTRWALGFEEKLEAVEIAIKQRHELHDRDMREAEAFMRVLQQQIEDESIVPASAMKH